MVATISAKRKNDAVITVRQNNTSQSIDIIGINAAAERLVGYKQGDIVNKPLGTVLPSKIRELITNYLEFEAGGNDLASVLRKVSKFNIINYEGRPIPVNLKVFYIISEDLSPSYELLMRDMSLLEKLEEMKHKLIAEHQSEILDESVNLPNAASLRQDLSMVNAFVKQYTVDATFVCCTIDHTETLLKKFGETAPLTFTRKIGEMMRQNFRDEDMIGYLGDYTLGLVLFDCNTENTQSVLNRIRKKIEASPVQMLEHDKLKNIFITASFGFSEITADKDIDKIISSSKQALQKAKEKSNSVFQAS